MPWQWLPQLLQQDPSAFGQVTFVWLAALAIGIGWYASRIPPRIPPSDLEQLHRRVDEVRQRIREASRSGKPVQQLQRLLDQMREQLPSGDARHY